MGAQVTSIKPVIGENGEHYGFMLTIKAGGTSRAVSPPIGAEIVLDARQVQAHVARYTGYLVAVGDWENQLPKIWQEPEPKPDRSGELEELD